jgi:hypothetical protein
MSETDPSSAVDWAAVDRALWDAKTRLQSAADAAMCCRGREPAEVADDAAHSGEYAAGVVWQLYSALPEGATERAVAYDAYSAAADGVSHLKYAGTLFSAEAAQPSYDAAQACFERAMHLIGW